MTSTARRLGPESELWAVTSYFNPAGWRVRRRNYRAFRRYLQVPLLTVELASARGAELDAGDADLYLRVEDGDAMWQKERLLNLGVAALPAHVTHVAWLDCDVVFPRDDWWRLALAALRESAVVQLFARLLHLGPEAPAGDSAALDALLQRGVVERELAVAPVIARLRRETGYLRRLAVRHRRTAGAPLVAKGVAWAARRELIERLGLYDRAIVGGGDSAALAAFAGDAEGLVVAASRGLGRTLGGPYLAWAQRAFALVGGRLGAISGDLFHFWHGAFERRAYAGRHDVLERHAFDPERDLHLGVDGAWKWASHKPGLHADVAAYFVARREDEPAAPVATRPRTAEAHQLGTRVG